ncbi:MAG: ATP-dependent DNA helicase [Candidatus Diapherotrites archaeon]|uniref:ATP-dependent DNA helicase Hel308 n=1 Tax=Candidatus Iainarchaeum sp. TaxID=3101447 RepID=A0A2D6LP63_9ARCH|nr:ATP-dependent DNA helicase [Candidatus Diapherotrites archaeon]|tara:strand:+ start:2387 stop:4486 length:2100 start_codon:yes stop_codon:yes gene_type:complete
MEITELVKHHNGFDSFNPMQKKAIDAGALEKSVVVSSPTASGKTVVAELASLNSILKNKKKVVYTCPLRALASEHSADFKSKYSKELGIKTVLSTGDFDSAGKYLSQKDIIFTTYEKLNSLLNHRADWLSEIGLLVVDEIHSIGSDRGATLEMLITKLRFLNKNIQVLGLSATIPNAKDLASWLDSELVESDYRPVELREGIFLEDSIDFGETSQEVTLSGDPTISICLDALDKGKQALVFANTRRSSEATAKRLANITEKVLSEKEKQILNDSAEKVLSVLEQPTVQCRTIAELIKKGTCFHNAGLLQKQREIVEDLFKRNYLKFISSTPTLAAGVNMPAYRVILQTPYRYTGFGMGRIPVSEWKQMAGRAGRPKYDSEGQAIILAKTEFEKDDYFDYFINGEIENMDSKLASEITLRFHLLAVISTGFVFDLESAEKFFSATFYANQTGNLSSLFNKITGIVKELEEMGFVDADENRIDATPLGKRVTELYLDPMSAFSIIESLKQNKFNDLAYLFTIANTSEFTPLVSAPNAKEAELWEQLQESKELLPVNVDAEMFSDNNILSKLWTSFLLKDWVEEVKEQELVDSFKVQPGILRAKLQNADWLAYSALELAKIIGLQEHFMHLNKMRKRLKNGIKEELVILCELRGIGRVRARRLFNSGIKSIKDVKKIDVKDLEKILSPKIAISVKQQLNLKK